MIHQCVQQLIELLINLGFNHSVFCICSSAGHGQKTGTNLHSALLRVSEVISFLKQNSAKNHFNETQNIIIIETDGKDLESVSQTHAHKHLSSISSS